jgi:outer membrane protein OmpA-like peptidoglycan-associated protein
MREHRLEGQDPHAEPMPSVAPPAAEAEAGLAGPVGNEPLSPASVLRMQQSQGNAHVARLLTAQLQRQPDAEQLARQAFLGKGLMPGAAGLDFQSATGIGGFNVKFDPARGAVVCTLRVGFVFNDALAVNTTTGAVTANDPTFATDAATEMANADQAKRIADVQTNFQWSGAQKTDFMSGYESLAEGTWGQKHYFTANRWNDVFANVMVDIDVHAGHKANDHCKATVWKVPEGSRSGPGAVVNSTGGNATASTGTFTSAQLGAPFDFLNYSLQFPKGSADLHKAVSTSREKTGDAGDAHLDKIIVDFQRARPGEGAAITITGHSSATGDHAGNDALAHKRAQAVAGYLETKGQMIAQSRITVVSAGDEGATADPTWQRADIQVGSGDPQRTLGHETGHMFGLDDEYASPPGGIAPGAGTPGAIGQPVAHGTLPPMGGGVQPAVSENNDNIMSVGNVVRPQHYITFLEALNTVSSEPFHYGGQGHSPDVVPDLIGPDALPVGPPGTAVV